MRAGCHFLLYNIRLILAVSIRDTSEKYILNVLKAASHNEIIQEFGIRFRTADRNNSAKIQAGMSV